MSRHSLSEVQGRAPRGHWPEDSARPLVRGLRDAIRLRNSAPLPGRLLDEFVLFLALRLPRATWWPRRTLSLAFDLIRGCLRQVPRPGLEPAQQAPAGEIEMDRCDGDPPVDDGVEIGAGHGQTRGWRPADPEIGDAPRIHALDQLILVDPSAEAGHL